MLVINFLFLLYYEYDYESNKYRFSNPGVQVLADALGIFQTTLAYIAVTSYYLEYKLTMKQQVIIADQAS